MALGELLAEGYVQRGGESSVAHCRYAPTAVS
jgi:hypothetical protein